MLPILLDVKIREGMEQGKKNTKHKQVKKKNKKKIKNSNNRLNTASVLLNPPLHPK